MPTPTEFWRWQHTNEFGKRVTTSYRLTRANAFERLTDPVPVEGSREVRNLPDNQAEHHLTSGFMPKERKNPPEP